MLEVLADDPWLMIRDKENNGQEGMEILELNGDTNSDTSTSNVRQVRSDAKRRPTDLETHLRLYDKKITQNDEENEEFQNKSLDISRLSDVKEGSENEESETVKLNAEQNNEVQNFRNKEPWVSSAHSLDEDYDMNEKDLDENYNSNINDNAFINDHQLQIENDAQQIK